MYETVKMYVGWKLRKEDVDETTTTKEGCWKIIQERRYNKGKKKDLKIQKEKLRGEKVEKECGRKIQKYAMIEVIRDKLQ